MQITGQHSTNSFRFWFGVATGLTFAALLFVIFSFFDRFKLTHNPSHDVVASSVRRGLPKLPRKTTASVKNLIIFYGDGLGINQIDAGRIEYAGKSGNLNMERMPVSGFVHTYSANNLITDSAASATAYATGLKTLNHMIGMSPDSVARRTILEAARNRGMATGLITTTFITDASPAAFCAHVADRDEQAKIALQIADSDINLLVGNLAYFFPKSDPRSLRTDNVDVINLVRQKGYEFIETEAEWINSEAEHVIANFSNNSLDEDEKAITPPSPTLAELTLKAIKLLEGGNNGFFLLVEEEGIDTGGHKNDFHYILEHLKNLDDAVAVGLQYAIDKGNTMVLVLSDHETGGLTFSKEKLLDSDIAGATWSTIGHTGQSVPLFAFGPNIEKFCGILNNTDIPVILADLLDLAGVGDPVNDIF